ncbi:MAG: SRPBCC domain-containing protein [Xanthobacteraceae bacterium]|nr:SRPBCC domain-containing protein [Xanthobacteraceae bacterium]
MTATATKSADFVISRVLDAPRDLVWKCFTDPEHMKQWWGPKGFASFSSQMDLRAGGRYHYGLKSLDSNVTIWGRMVYREIVPPEKLVLVSSFSDEQGGLSRHPMAPTWPIEMLAIFTFEEQPGGKTRFTVRWSPLNATAEEQRAFDEGHGSMNQGWSGTLEKLETHVANFKTRAA